MLPDWLTNEGVGGGVWLSGQPDGVWKAFWCPAAVRLWCELQGTNTPQLPTFVEFSHPSETHMFIDIRHS